MKQTMIRAALCTSAFCLAVPAAAQVRYFDFTIDGFTDGATITGTFAGEDLDNDGALVTIRGSGEITQFSAHFSGNSLVGAMDFGMADMGPGSGLLYAFGNPTFTGTGGSAGQEGFAAGFAGGRIIGGGRATGQSCDGVNACFLVTTDGLGPNSDYSSSLGVVTEVAAPPSVPEPASWALMASGFGVAGAAMRRRRIAFA